MFRNKPVVSILLKYCGVATIALCITSVAQGGGIGGGVDNIPFKPLAGAMTFGDEYKVFVDYEAISGPVIYRDDVSDEEQEGYDLSSSLRVSGEWRRLVHDYQKEDMAYSVIDHIKRGWKTLILRLFINARAVRVVILQAGHCTCLQTLSG
ncbi:hypothetical protein [Endozoicomonas sp. ALE010]|uniref:hypothetical protein n=1 Tax=Endozoicomonas sp. ALE010 TaxID=3403081 RepID=UPI003BB67C36